ncbi:MAG: hypothetical protein HYX89_08195 [Chloroflexi bacterium]|nr:hypothetical protein [Chloroflexota bacterium]
MELRTYWAIFWRRWWLAAGVVVLVFAVSLFALPGQVISYSSQVRVAVQPQLPITSPEYSPAFHEYYAYAASEYLVDDLAEMVKTSAFSADVQQRVREAIGRTPQGTFDSKKAHRLLTLTVTSLNAEDARVLAQEAGRVLTTPGNPYLAVFSQQNPSVTLVDQVDSGVSTDRVRSAFNVAMRLVLALFVGVGLAFLLDYLDDTLRDAREVEERMNLRVIGELPAGGRQ